MGGHFRFPSGELLSIDLDRARWPMSVSDMQADIRSLKREIRNEGRPSAAIQKRRKAQKAQRAARRRNRHG